MNDPTFVLVTGRNLEGRATAQNNAALVYLSATQALLSSYRETVTLERKHSKNSHLDNSEYKDSSPGAYRIPRDEPTRRRLVKGAAEGMAGGL